MRSSKSRSRSKSNRNRSMGNIVNRVFESSGPEGKVRGTPQQIIDKYNQLARDAQLGNDRVALENFQQHAEHYTRMLSEAQKEQEARREQQERERAERQSNNQNQNREQRQQGQQGQQGGQQDAPVAVSEPDAPQPEIEFVNASDSGLVETPESQQDPKPKRQRRRKPEAKSDAIPAEGADQPAASDDSSETAEAAE